MKWTYIKLKNISQKSNYTRFPILGNYGVFTDYPVEKIKPFAFDLSFNDTILSYNIKYVALILRDCDRNTAEHDTLKFLTRINDIEVLFIIPVNLTTHIE